MRLRFRKENELRLLTVLPSLPYDLLREHKVMVPAGFHTHGKRVRVSYHQCEGITSVLNLVIT